MKAIGVIPARLGSTRLHEKVLQPIGGRPMIVHVYERAKQAKRLSGVLVACDHERILKCVQDAGGRAVLTRADHPNGTSRVAEIAEKEGADFFVNIQGDEPLIQPGNIDLLVAAFERTPSQDVFTLAVRRSGGAEYENPNVVKVVCAENGNALYFSRSPIPHDRDSGGKVPAGGYLKHLGIYGYRRDFLLKFVRMKPGRLEQIEKLEQLRILERGYSIRVIETPHDSVGVDTQEDLNRAAERIGAE
ncbi:MAG: hypothetical protein A2Z83_08460 [Omnitrophica bacterium GWA2_52_8]|nr:MAG: hypothetical protein A2Z83_08460 [Omnitrophica bacterium GWA2_52_8]